MLQPDVSDPKFYYPYIFSFSLIYAFVQILIWIFKSNDEHEYHDLDEEEKILVKDEAFLKKGKLLKINYMAAYLLAKASMWAKAPYTFMLFSTYHGFTIGQIGMLYLIDAICSLFSGPFIGILADTFGRKVVALVYPLNTILILLMRMSGNIPMVYFAQVMTGFAGNVLATSFESWLNYEIIKLYGNQKSYIQHFRKNMFSKLLFWDSVLSLAVTIIGAIIYNYFGIFAALSLSILLAAASGCVIIALWSENRPNSDHNMQLIDSFKEGLKLLKSPPIFFLGLVDSFYCCAIQIIIFVWTPVLQETAQNKNINPAMIYLVMILTILIHNKFLEFLHRSIRIDFFNLAACYLLFFLTNWIGSGGLFNPVLSYLRSIVLVEQYRTLLMNLFRVPLNLILITMLVLSNYLNPFQICLITGIVLIVPLLSSVYLIYYHYLLKLKKECELKEVMDTLEEEQILKI